MIPLPKPLGYWEKIQSYIFNFRWKGKPPRIKITQLQQPKGFGDLDLPNFKFYALSLDLHPLMKWPC